jgi:enamine deaminase RidA (YjgF/YER057c/UK114 family)
MITDRIDPPGLLKIPEIVNVSVATGTRIVHISGQTAVGPDGKIVGTTYLEQCRETLRNVKMALESVGATVADVAKFTTYMVDYTWEALEALLTAGKETWGDQYPRTANTLIGVAALWLPGILVEVEAVAVL